MDLHTCLPESMKSTESISQSLLSDYDMSIHNTMLAFVHGTENIFETNTVGELEELFNKYIENLASIETNFETNFEKYLWALSSHNHIFTRPYDDNKPNSNSYGLLSFKHYDILRQNAPIRWRVTRTQMNKYILPN